MSLYHLLLRYLRASDLSMEAELKPDERSFILDLLTGLHLCSPVTNQGLIPDLVLPEHGFFSSCTCYILSF